MTMSAYFQIKISKMGDASLEELINLAQTPETKMKNGKTAGDKISSFLNQTVMIFKPPYLITTLIIGIVMICLMSSYFTLVMWLPEVFNRFATFEGMFPGEAANICSITDVLRRNATNFLTPKVKIVLFFRLKKVKVFQILTAFFYHKSMSVRTIIYSYLFIILRGTSYFTCRSQTDVGSLQ